MRGKTAPKRGEMTPDAWNFSRNAKLGTWNGLQLYKACIIGTWNEKTEERKPQNKHFYSSKHGQTVSTSGTKLSYKNGSAREAMKQVVDAKPKRKKTLLQHWRGTKNMTTYSLWKPPKQYTGMLKMPFKVGPKRGQNTKYTKHSSNSLRPLIKRDKGVKIWPLSVRTKVQKQNKNRLKKSCKMRQKHGFQSK